MPQLDDLCQNFIIMRLYVVWSWNISEGDVANIDEGGWW